MIFGKNGMKRNKTKIILMYGCRTKKDILLQKELEELQSQNPDQFKIIYTLSQSREKNDKFANTGRIGKEMLLNVCNSENLLQTNSKKTCQVWVCGTPSFYLTICGKREEKTLSQDCILKELGFKENQIVKF